MEILIREKVNKAGRNRIDNQTNYYTVKNAGEIPSLGPLNTEDPSYKARFSNKLLRENQLNAHSGNHVCRGGEFYNGENRLVGIWSLMIIEAMKKIHIYI